MINAFRLDANGEMQDKLDKEHVILKLMDRGIDDNGIMDITGVPQDKILGLRLKRKNLSNYP